jgi:hypothetical protein
MSIPDNRARHAWIFRNEAHEVEHDTTEYIIIPEPTTIAGGK